MSAQETDRSLSQSLTADDDSSDTDSNHEKAVVRNINEWLQVRWLCMHPVYGTKSARVFHHIFLLSAVAYSFWMALRSKVIRDFLQSIDAPKNLEYGKWLFFLHLASTSIRVFLAERILDSPEASRLLAAAFNNRSLHSDVDFDWKHSTKSIKCVEQERLILASAVSAGPLLIVVGGVAFMCSLVLQLQGYDFVSFFANYIVLACLCGWAGSASANSVRILTALVCLNIVRLRSYLDEVASSEEIPKEFFWAHMIKEYLELDSMAIKVYAGASSIVALVVSVGLCVAWFFFIIGVIELSRLPGVCVVCFCISAIFSGYVLSLLYPLARVNSLSHSLEATEPSLLTASLRCAVIPMAGDQNSKYLKFLDVVERCALGAKLPFVGLITMGDIVNYTKIIACIIPAALSYSFIVMDIEYEYE